MPFSTANNSFQVSNLIAKQMFPSFINALGMSGLAKSYMGFNNNASAGDSRRFIYPQQLSTYDGLSVDLTTQNNNIFVREQTITLDIQKTTPFSMTAEQMSFFSMTENDAEFDAYYMTSAARSIGNQVDSSFIDRCEMYWSDAVGDPTQPISGQASMALYDSQFSNMGLRQINGGNDRYVVFHPDSINSLQLAYPSYFNEGMSTPIMLNSRRENIYGMKVGEDVLMKMHTNGTFAASGNVTVATTVPLTTTINDAFTLVSLSGFTANATGVLNKGDLISFIIGTTPVRALNPDSYQPYNNAKKFYVMGSPNGSGGFNASVDADGSGNAQIAVFAPIVANPADNYRNVSAQVTSGAIVSLFGGASTVYRKSFGFIRDGFFAANPPVATFPNPSIAANQKYSAFPTEMVLQMKVPGSDLPLSLNVASQGDIGLFNNQWTVRTIAAALPLNGYGFTIASAT